MALGAVADCIVMAAGSGKTEIVQRVIQNDSSLPIVQATQTIEHNGGNVVWLVDSVAFGDTAG